MKYFIISFLCLYNICNSQVSISWTYSKANKTAEINIYNNSNHDIVLPLDSKSLKPYQEDQCSISDYEFPYPILGLTLLVNNSNEKIVGNISNIEIPDNDNDFKKIVAERDSINNEYLSLIKKWSNKNKLTDLGFAKVNYYLTNNLIILKSKKSIRFKANVDFDNITTQKYISYNYSIDWSKKNEVSLSFCIDQSVYNYLTEKQKLKLKKYRLFTGNIQSNKIPL